MELHEITRRILGQHWRLIVAFVVAGLAVGVIVHSGVSRSYTATARLTIDTQDPKSQPESTSIADTVDAIATSPSLVEQALNDAHLRGRDAQKVARSEISTSSVGTSGVVELSVSDRNPRAAAALANALANRVIKTRLAVTRGSSVQALTELDANIARLDRQISELDSRVATLNLQAATTASPRTANGLRARSDDTAQQRDFLSQQRSVLETQRASLASANAQLPEPTVIGSASPPTRADSSAAAADIVLGFLLGAILGVGVAAVVETFRPTIVGGEALARELDAPLLGTIETYGSGKPDALHLMEIADRLRLAARAEVVGTISLLGAGRTIDVGLLARELDELVTAPEPSYPEEEAELALAHAGNGERGRVRRASGRGLAASSVVRVRPFDSRSFGVGNRHGYRNGNGRGNGVVLIAPSVVKYDALADARHLLRINPGQLLGVVTCEPSQRRFRLRERREVGSE